MMHLEKATITDIKSLFSGRKLYARCGDIRFEITKASFMQSYKSVSNKVTFDVVSNDRFIQIEAVTQA